MSGYATTQKILRASYFWPSIFKDYIVTIRKFHDFHIYQHKMCAPPIPLHHVVTIGPFVNWGINFMMCNPHSARGNAYIIVVVDYFTKWAEAMPTLAVDGKTTSQFIFNHIIEIGRAHV